MIADQAMDDASPVLDFAGKVQAFLASANAAAGDGLTWVEFGELLVALLRLSVQTLDATLTLTGPEKSRWCLRRWPCCSTHSRIGACR